MKRKNYFKISKLEEASRNEMYLSYLDGLKARKPAENIIPRVPVVTKMPVGKHRNLFK